MQHNLNLVITNSTGERLYPETTVECERAIDSANNEVVVINKHKIESEV